MRQTIKSTLPKSFLKQPDTKWSSGSCITVQCFVIRISGTVIYNAIKCQWQCITCFIALAIVAHIRIGLCVRFANQVQSSNDNIFESHVSLYYSVNVSTFEMLEIEQNGQWVNCRLGHRTTPPFSPRTTQSIPFSQRRIHFAIIK